jgi:hypothetical protein
MLYNSEGEIWRISNMYKNEENKSTVDNVGIQ